MNHHRLRLEKFAKEDYERLIGWADSAEALMQFAGPVYSFPLTGAQLDKSVNDPQRLTYRVADIASGQIIGHAEIYLKETTACLMRILIGNSDFRGKGLGQELIKELVVLSFLNLGYSQVELNVYDWNTSAIKCYENVGFTLNPHKKTEAAVNGQTWVALNMVIDKAQWEQYR